MDAWNKEDEKNKQTNKQKKRILIGRCVDRFVRNIDFQC